MHSGNKNGSRGLHLAIFKYASLLAIFGLALFQSVSSAHAATPTIRAGYPQLNGARAPLWVISEAGLDRQYGFEFRSVYIAGGARLTQTVVSGDVDLAITGGAAINAMLSGADMIYIGMPVPTFAFSLYAGPDIKEVPDLRGKILGVITKGASSDHASIALLRQYKMSQGKDLKVLYFSRQQDALAALDKKIVSAAVLSAPTTLMARRLGFKEIVNIGSLKFPYPFAGIAVGRSRIRQHPELATAFLKGYVAALKIVHEQPDVARRALARYLATQDKEIVEEAYRAFEPLLPRIPYVTEEAIRAALSFTDHAKAAAADPKDFFDNRFLKDLESSGFAK